MLTLGVDAHQQQHVAVALDASGQVVAEWRGANDATAWQDLLDWASALAPERQWGIEGARGYGRGLAQVLVAAGETVRDVNPRQTAARRRRGTRRGKTDRLDATAVARVVREEPTACPRVMAEDVTSVLAVLVGARADALAETTRLRNQLHALLGQLDPTYRQSVGRLTDRRVIARLAATPLAAAPTAAAASAPLPGVDPVAVARAQAIQRIAERLLLALAQVATFATEIEALAREHLAPLLVLPGIGALSAGMLAAELGPGRRWTHEAQLARHAGVAPLEASSGASVRHRLDRGGNRQLNAILERMALTQRRCHPQAQTYLARKRAEGKTDREAIRCLKRYLARAVYHAWQQCLDHLHPSTCT